MKLKEKYQEIRESLPDDDQIIFDRVIKKLIYFKNIREKAKTEAAKRIAEEHITVCERILRELKIEASDKELDNFLVEVGKISAKILKGLAEGIV
ncbi:MAG: hypothetical protein K9M56_04210 [Victivallales bacterium]|nr:hypothetical protein [Victivallales bacterium]